LDSGGDGPLELEIVEGVGVLHRIVFWLEVCDVLLEFGRSGLMRWLTFSDILAKYKELQL
jgi:hypothetical protein